MFSYRLCLLLMLSPFLVAAEEPFSAAEQTIQREIAVLSSCEPERCPVFYVPMLGRQFPIPDRYELGKSGTPGFRRYISPKLATSKERLISGEALAGNIVIGPLAEFNKGRHASVLRPIGTIDGVRIFAMSLAARPDEYVADILIAGDEYAMIGDQNRQLPELLLKLSERLSKSAAK